jgi:uncharacterized protein (DUF1697 family)
MNTYLVLLRGVNVGGKNRVPMAELKKCLEDAGYLNVVTYIASGNVIVQSPLTAHEVKTQIEKVLPKAFTLDDELIKVLIVSYEQLKSIVNEKPKGFGEHPEKYHSDVIFLMDISIEETMPIFNPREGVDAIWLGKGVVYSQRLSAERTKSRLNAVMSSPLYKSMTIRSWSTTMKLFEMLKHAAER